MKTCIITLEAAHLALNAFDYSITDHDGSNSLGVAKMWIRSSEMCHTPDDSRVGKALKALRNAWYHNGSRPARQRVYVAAAKLRFEIDNL